MLIRLTLFDESKQIKAHTQTDRQKNETDKQTFKHKTMKNRYKKYATHKLIGKHKKLNIRRKEKKKNKHKNNQAVKKNNNNRHRDRQKNRNKTQD
jgi:hypothetical protein